MKQYLYLSVIGLIPLYAWTCKSYPERDVSRQLKVLGFDCPDTVETGAAFEFSFRVRVADCEKVIWTSVNLGKDTANFSLEAKRKQFAKGCDTSQPFRSQGMSYSFATPGRRYFVLGVNSYRYLDSIYVK